MQQRSARVGYCRPFAVRCIRLMFAASRRAVATQWQRREPDLTMRRHGRLSRSPDAQIPHPVFFNQTVNRLGLSAPAITTLMNNTTSETADPNIYANAAKNSGFISLQYLITKYIT